MMMMIDVEVERSSDARLFFMVSPDPKSENLSLSIYISRVSLGLRFLWL
jgi:hypothetical protein